ncbi:SpoIIE family protein phosphatase [Candidatus Falkowbacteria bacterium]|nr:SpoIIE family protein phosphatase [Candidatus Falkowbacteria bacterium]
MKISILPNKTKQLEKIEKRFINDSLVMGSTNGLKKQINEDSVGYCITKKSLRICIADGHWGTQASKFITKSLLNPMFHFPVTKIQSRQITEKLEHMLYKKLKKHMMDEEKNFSPEASFIAIEISNNTLLVTSYGDCRMLVANKGKLKFQIKMTRTWLGVFSYLGLRKRISVKNAIQFKKIKLKKNDIVILFTDGVDECIYEKPTISFKKIALYSNNSTPHATFNFIFKKIFEYGAEDNASLVIYQH